MFSCNKILPTFLQLHVRDISKRIADSVNCYGLAVKTGSIAL